MNDSFCFPSMISHGYCFKVCLFRLCSQLLLKNFRDCITVHLSRYKQNISLLFTVLHCQLRDSFVILAQLVVTCQHLFLKLFETFFCLRGSLESYFGLWLSVVSFVVFCRIVFDDLAILPKCFHFGNPFFDFFLLL